MRPRIVAIALVTTATGLGWLCFALFTAPGVAMIQNGQEFAEDYWIMEDDQGTGRRIRPRPLRWDFKDDGIGAPTLRLFSKLA